MDNKEQYVRMQETQQLQEVEYERNHLQQAMQDTGMKKTTDFFGPESLLSQPPQLHPQVPDLVSAPPPLGAVSLPPLPQMSSDSKDMDKGMVSMGMTMGGDHYVQHPPPPPHLVIDLFQNEEKNLEDIESLLKYGVDLNVISEVKNTTIQALLNFCAVKQIPIPTSAFRKEVLSVGGALEVPQHPHGMGTHLKPVRTLPSMMDDDLKKKRKQPWKKSDFPLEKINGLDYFCSDCKKPNKTYHCECKRKCWKWCEACTAFRSNHHDHFKGANPKKRRKPWTEKAGGYFCGDCKKEYHKRLCDCGRDCWKWCTTCGEYRSKHHFNVEHRDLEEPRRKKRKLIGEPLPPQMPPGM